MSVLLYAILSNAELLLILMTIAASKTMERILPGCAWLRVEPKLVRHIISSYSVCVHTQQWLMIVGCCTVAVIPDSSSRIGSLRKVKLSRSVGSSLPYILLNACGYTHTHTQTCDAPSVAENHFNEARSNELNMCQCEVCTCHIKKEHVETLGTVSCSS